MNQRVELFSNVTQNLRSNGGDVAVFAVLHRNPRVRDIGERASYDTASVRVELTVPFIFSGQALVANVHGVYCSEEEWVCFSKLHKRAKLELAADQAMKLAMERLIEHVPQLIRGARPTTSNKKVSRKARDVLKLLVAAPKSKETTK